MNNGLLFLKPEIVLQPLINNWPAWTYLISPLTYEFLRSKKHHSLMKAFIESPDLIKIASQTPELKGGDFIEFSNDIYSRKGLFIDQISEIQRFSLVDDIAKVENVCSEIEFKDDIRHAYLKVPVSLDGIIEFYFDHRGRVDYRICERTLYERYYDRNIQSISLLKLDGSKRPFLLTTPVFPSMDLSFPFDSLIVDELARSRVEGIRSNRLRELLSIDSDLELNICEYFGNENPNLQQSNGCTVGDVSVKYFGHASILFETKSSSIFIDPQFCSEPKIDAYGYNHIPLKLDAIVLTHNHMDHVMLDALLELRHRVKTIFVPPSSGNALLDPSLKIMLEAIGFKNVTELGKFEGILIGDFNLRALPFYGEHCDLDITSKMCVAINVYAKCFLLTADSNFYMDSQINIFKKWVGENPILFVGMESEGAPLKWAYGPFMMRRVTEAENQQRRTDGSNYDQVKKLVDTLKPELVYIYAMGQEKWLNHICSTSYDNKSPAIIESDKLIKYCSINDVPCERLLNKKVIRFDG